MSNEFKVIEDGLGQQPLGYPHNMNDLFALVEEHPDYAKYEPLLKQRYKNLGEFCVSIDMLIKRCYDGNVGLSWDVIEDYIQDAFTDLDNDRHEALSNME
jgi:hypothetical protein